MVRRVARMENPVGATAVTPRHSRRSWGVDPSTLPFLPLMTPPAASRNVVLPGRRPDYPPRAGDTLKQRRNESTDYGAMPRRDS